MAAPELPPVADSPAGATFGVRVIPRSGRSQVAGVRHGALLIKLAARPVDGAANNELVTLLAECLGVRRRQITLVAGERSRDKRVRVAGLNGAQLGLRLAGLLGRHV